jgi:hypothetical protein
VQLVVQPEGGSTYLLDLTRSCVASAPEWGSGALVFSPPGQSLTRECPAPVTLLPSPH